MPETQTAPAAVRRRSSRSSVEKSRRPLTIGMLAPCPFPTHQGTQVLIRHLATTLSRAGHDLHFVTYGYGEYEEEFSFHLHRAACVDAGLRSGPNLRKTAADAALLYTAARVSRSYKCDLWHVHNVEGLGLGALLKLQTGLPLVYHAHNAMGPELPTYFRAHLAQAFASLVGEVLDRTLPLAADAVIAFDPDHKALHEVYGVKEKTIHVIPPGLDGTEISRPCPDVIAAMREKLGNGPWLLYAGNPDGYQNLRLMWEAFKIVRGRRPDVRLLVATQHEPVVFERELEEAGSPEGVVFHKYDDIEELRALFAIADIGLCPRTIWTGAPIKVLNHLAAGLQTVACRSAARYILSPSAGLLVDDTAEAFARGVISLLDEPIGDRAKCRRAFERFRLENHVPLYDEVYNQVLGSRRKS